ncbi:Clat_adaptor_s domain-containing protein [Meloidogyne graminicola]|uniref:Coatomer subunit zeta n=1 Tax=Meloidogyne graminicola TaxID=189291 RepID=A0A8S9ZMC8_9BILA|nr:Clat_adaptor_s domain-containing protein [Meloidogyne graminicola]
MSNLDADALYSIKAILILDQDGKRILGKYYDKQMFQQEKEKSLFEKIFSQKTHKANAEIILLDGYICVYRSNVDLFFYVIGSSNENELILQSVLNCFYDSFSTVLRKNVEKKVLFDHIDLAFLILDEICDDGLVLETDSQAIVNRCAFKPDEISFGEQSLSQKNLVCEILIVNVFFYFSVKIQQLKV